MERERVGPSRPMIVARSPTTSSGNEDVSTTVYSALTDSTGQRVRSQQHRCAGGELIPVVDAEKQDRRAHHRSGRSGGEVIARLTPADVDHPRSDCANACRNPRSSASTLWIGEMP